MYEIENNCVGPCPMGCIHCSHDYKQYYCDDCGADQNEDRPLYRWHGKELCFDCIKETMISKILDDMDDTTCSECGHEADELYQWDDEWVCEECLRDMLEYYIVEDDE